MLATDPRIKQALKAQWGRREVARVELTLPVPPSTNSLTRNRTSEEIERARAAGRPVRGRKKTDRYLSWIRGAGSALNVQRPGRVGGPYGLTIMLPRAETKMDLDNLKAVPDLLQQHDVIDSDRFAEWIYLRWIDHGTEMLVTVQAEARQA